MDLNDLALELPCPYCSAEPSYWCTTRTSGRVATWLHTARLRQVQDAWRIGWREGQRGALGAMAQRLEAARLGHHWARDAPSASDEVVTYLRDAANRISN